MISCFLNIEKAEEIQIIVNILLVTKFIKLYLKLGQKLLNIFYGHVEREEGSLKIWRIRENFNQLRFQ